MGTSPCPTTPDVCVFVPDDHKKHSLYYVYTALTKAGPFPEFTAEAESDDKQIAHYSNEKRAWERDNLTVGVWNKAPAEPPETRESFLKNLYDLAMCELSTVCSEFHVLQRITGCEVVKLDGTVTNWTAFDNYAYDGKDCSSYNFNHPLPWTNKIIEYIKIHHQAGQNPFLTNFLIDCMNWILTFNNTFRTPPNVYVYAKKAPDDDSKLNLICLATGFYPRDVEMYIRLDRNILEDQTSSEIRPNEDETFQRRISVKINRNPKGSYDCFVIHNSLREPISAEWDKKCSNCEPQPQRPGIAVALGLAGPCLLLVCICWICCKRRRSSGL
ncbi:zinc-alpha-2-glycoprotein-like [Garra rufa]|uniref:zinc-alpha-2-glycoprotein-like n=1 Tax=Garra rufa TaxID=137080 RepID=UPI003CCE65FC